MTVPSRAGAASPQVGLGPPVAPTAECGGRGGSVTHLLYLHGFRSSPQSAKARQTAAWMQAHRPDVHWWCPQLPPSPAEAMGLLNDGTQDWPAARTGVIGSSLGGFYATAVAERSGCRAVLLNPAVDPARDLTRHIGEITAWHSDERFFFRPEFIDELRAIRPAVPTRLERYFAVIAKGDELLSWVDMSERYRGARIKLLEASDHALSDFADHLGEVVDFLDLGA
jgi:predicted esterase YcpF (UPF0227 family)